jgi:hypothetical protein
MMLFNLQRIEYYPDRKMSDFPENEKEYLTAEYFLILRSYTLPEKSLTDQNMSLFVKKPLAGLLAEALIKVNIH